MTGPNIMDTGSFFDFNVCELEGETHVLMMTKAHFDKLMVVAAKEYLTIEGAIIKSPESAKEEVEGAMQPKRLGDVRITRTTIRHNSRIYFKR